MSISAVLQPTLNLLTTGKEIYKPIAVAMDSVEGFGHSGKKKFELVMDYAKALLIELGKNPEKWIKYITDFINSAKSLYNSIKSIV